MISSSLRCSSSRRRVVLRWPAMAPPQRASRWPKLSDSMEQVRPWRRLGSRRRSRGVGAQLGGARDVDAPRGGIDDHAILPGGAFDSDVAVEDVRQDKLRVAAEWVAVAPAAR